MDSNGQLYNTLPEELQNAPAAHKYPYYDYDEEIGMPLISPVFEVNKLRQTTYSPANLLRHQYDPFESIAKNKMAEDEYLLCCPTKCGQHWMWEIMRMLLGGTSEYMSKPKGSEWIDMLTMEMIRESTVGPRVLCTHLSLSCLPEGFLSPSTKVVVMLRNFKDMMVSYYHYMRSIKIADITWEDVFKISMYSKKKGYGNMFDVFADIWDNFSSNPNVLIVWYEDLKKNTEDVVERLAKHLEVGYTPELISKITEAVSIDNMREANTEKRQDCAKWHGNSVYRKGIVGDWKNMFTEEQNAEFQKVFDKWNEDRQIPMVFE